MTSDREKSRLHVEIVCALPQRQTLIAIEVEEGCTVGEALERCAVLQQFPEIDVARISAGVFGKIVPLDTPLRDGDRVEIYRPLLADPQQARRERAQRSPRRSRRG